MLMRALARTKIVSRLISVQALISQEFLMGIAKKYMYEGSETEDATLHTPIGEAKPA